MRGFPGGSDSKESASNAGDPNSVSGLGRSPGGGHGNPLQYSCLENPKDRGAWQATVYGGGKESDKTEQLTHTTHTAGEKKKKGASSVRVPDLLWYPINLLSDFA